MSAGTGIRMQTSHMTARLAQRAWAATPLRHRLRLVSAFRQEMAAAAEALAGTVPLDNPGSLHRTLADTLASEVLPLLEACRFLEREASFVLAPRNESASSRPRWLGGVSVETRRDPFGLVLIIAPGNYPLFLPGVQALQALVAGNAVLWKPAPGGRTAALAFERMFTACGLDPALLTILDVSPVAATSAVREGVDKVVLTGSGETGRAVLRELAETLTPSIMELSGCDAIFVLEGADLNRVVDAVTFALRLNGSATCMAPRRVFVTEPVADKLVPMLTTALDQLPPVQVTELLHDTLRDTIAEATLYGAKLLLNGLDVAPEDEGSVYATLLTDVTPEMRIAQADLFAPVLSVVRVPDQHAGIAAYAACPYALTAAIFGPSAQSESLASKLEAGTVLINDIIIPTADPRASFGGRKASGFGVTRGREGLLAMTAPKTILRQGSRSRRAYQPTGDAHVPFFAGLAQLLHARGLRARWQGAKTLIAAAQKIK